MGHASKNTEAWPFYILTKSVKITAQRPCFPYRKSWPFRIYTIQDMKNSFVDAIKYNLEAREAAKSVKPEVVSAEAATEDAEGAEEGQEEEIQAKSDISDEVIKKLSGKESFTKTIQEAKNKKEAEALAAQEAEDAEILAAEQSELEQEESEAEKEKPVKQSFKLGEQEFESIEAVNTHLQAREEEFTDLQQEVDDIRGFVEKVSDPEILDILGYVAKGYSFRVAMMKAGIDESIFTVEAEDEDAESLVRSKIERKQAVANQKKQDEKLQSNMDLSNKTLTDFQAQEGFDDKIKEQLVTKMSKFYDDAMNGVISTEFLSLFSKALTYEGAVKKAAEQGEVKGRNEKIAIERQKRKGDAMPQLGRGAEAKADPVRKSRLSELVTMPPSSMIDMINKNRR